MTSQSNKHHYIPEYYLRGFCDSQGKLFVYNKNLARLDKSGKTPAQVFYKEGHHTLTVLGKKNVFIEEIYSQMESRCSDFLKMISGPAPADIADIRSDENCCNIIKLMISIQFWRLPSSANIANTMSKNLMDIFDEFHCRDNKIPQMDREAVKRLYKNRDKKNIKKIIQFLVLPLVTCNFDGKLPADLIIINTDDYEYDLLCSDRPIFYEDGKDIGFSFDSLFKGKFFFPLTKRVALFKLSDSISIDLDAIQRMTVRNANEKYFGSSTALVERFRPAPQNC